MIRVALTLPVIVLAGCSDPVPEEATSGSGVQEVVHETRGVQRDSAGITLVLVPPLRSLPASLTLDTNPVASFGGLEADPEMEIGMGKGTPYAIRISEGRYAILDGTRVRIHAASGATLKLTGRKGGGPGEFEELASLCATSGDTLVVNDPFNGRVTILDPQGKIIRGIPVGRVEVPWHGGCLDDGRFVELHSVAIMGGGLGLLLVRRSIDGMQADTLGRYWARSNDLFLPSAATFVALGQEIYYGDPRTGEIRVLNVDGDVTRIIRLADPPEVLTRADQSALQTPYFGKRTNDPELIRRSAEKVRLAPRPTKWPAFDKIAIDPTGRIWVVGYRKGRTAPYVYTAINPDGNVFGRLIMPAPSSGGDPLVIGFSEEGVLVLCQDEDGATRLAVHRLVATDTPESVK